MAKAKIVHDVADEPREGALTVSPEKVFFIIVKAREFDAKDEVTDPGDASNPSDDGEAEVLEDHGDDPVLQEITSFINALTVDEQIDLIALAWLGRDDYAAADWPSGRGGARPKQGPGELPARPAAARRLPRRGALDARLFARGIRDRPFVSLFDAQAVQGDFRRTVEAHRHHRRSGADRRVAGHAPMAPRAGAEPPRHRRLERDRNSARQANLAAVGVAAQQQIESGLGRLAKDLRRMREQDGKVIARNAGGGLADVVHAIEVRVVDAGKMNALSPALDRHAFVEQHADAHVLERRHHADRVVIAQ